MGRVRKFRLESGTVYLKGRRGLPKIEVPPTGQYIHIRIHRPGIYQRIRTLDVGKPGHMVFRIGIRKRKGERGGRTEVQSILISKGDVEPILVGRSSVLLKPLTREGRIILKYLADMRPLKKHVVKRKEGLLFKKVR